MLLWPTLLPSRSSEGTDTETKSRKQHKILFFLNAAFKIMTKGEAVALL